MAHQFINRNIPLRALTVGLDDVKRVFERLSKHVEEEAERQTKELIRPPDQSEEEFAKQVMIARKNAFRITVTISGADGDLFGDRLELFSSPNLPDEIRGIYMTNVVAYQGKRDENHLTGFH